MFYVPRAAVPVHPQLSCLKQSKCISLQFWRLEVWSPIWCWQSNALWSLHGSSPSSPLLTDCKRPRRYLSAGVSPPSLLLSLHELLACVSVSKFPSPYTNINHWITAHPKSSRTSFYIGKIPISKGSHIQRLEGEGETGDEDFSMSVWETQLKPWHLLLSTALKKILHIHFFHPICTLTNQKELSNRDDEFEAAWNKGQKQYR